MISETLYVWIYLSQATESVVAGRLDIEKTAAGTIGHFTYGQSYLARAEAIPLDPVALPLARGVTDFSALSGFPGCVLDSCPDRWGMKVIDRLDGAKTYPIGYILMNDPGRAGALAFSRSAEHRPSELESRQFSLEELWAAANAVESNRDVDPELLKALHPGTGGARPKCNVVDQDSVWIAKFPSILDSTRISIPRLEHATMRLAEQCGIRSAETRLEKVGGQDVCMVKRFDRTVDGDQIYRKAFLSARSLFYADPAFATVGTGSYGRIARWLQRYGQTEREEVFRRMVFNVAVRNSDDHELNHGLVYAGRGSFDLSPAYDIVPLLTPHQVHHHALLIGDSSAGTVENLLSGIDAFGLNRGDALGIIADIESRIKSCWQEVFYEAGFDDNELRLVEKIFQPIPLQESTRAATIPGGPSRKRSKGVAK